MCRCPCRGSPASASQWATPAWWPLTTSRSSSSRCTPAPSCCG
ncbi:unnamed protein product [Ixodes pacificus]